MVRFVKGAVVVIPFPFSDLSETKRRPAFVITSLPGDDVILCQITSQKSGDTNAVLVTNTDFSVGGLSKNSYVRAGKLFTADARIILRQAGLLKPSKIQEVIEMVVRVINA